MFDKLIASIESWGRKHELTRLQFDELANQAAQAIQNDERAYKQRVITFGLLGYVFIFSVVAVMLAFSICCFILFLKHHNTGSFKLLLLLVISNGILLYSLWVRNSPPAGIELKRESCPQLFSLIDELQKKLKVRIDKVLLNDDLNACVCQIPQLGILGFPKNYLVLGYPLMLASSPECFKATLAHEFGHISGNHGKSGAWIYTVNTMYSQLLANLRAGAPLLYCIFYAFFHWYAPRFAAYSLVLRRQHEYDADRLSIELTDAKTASLDLINVHLKGQALSEKFWPEIYKLADKKEAPPTDLMARMKAFLNTGINEDTASKWYAQHLRLPTQSYDSHPSLLDRLAFAGFPSAIKEQILATALPTECLLVPEKSAAEELLADKEEGLADVLVKLWIETLSPSWAARIQQVEQFESSLKQIEEKRLTGELSKEELGSEAFITLELHGYETAKPLISALIIKDPENSWAHMILGYHKLEEGDDSGIAMIEKSMNVDITRIPDACRYLTQYYTKAGDYKKAEEYLQKIDSFESVAGLAYDERLFLSDKDSFTDHEQSEELIEKIKKQLIGIKELKNAYLAKKQVSHLSEFPCYILGVQFKAGIDWDGDRNAELVGKVASALEFPGDLRVFHVNNKIAGKMKSCKDSVIYAA